MRKLMIWILVLLMALSGFALAESADAAVTAVNGSDAVRVGSDVYFAIPNGTRQMLVRVPTNGGDPICVDRADRFEDLIPYAGGLVYLKTENNSSAIMACNGLNVSTVYGFGTSRASCLTYYDGKLQVLIDGLLHSIDPGTQLCLRQSGSEMMDYVVDGGSAYYLSAGDRMEYTATLQDGQTVSTQAGCVYSLDLNSGATTLLLKSGGRDLQIANGQLYFHSLADAYAVRVGDSAQLMGRVHSLDVQQHTLGDVCGEPDSGFWALEGGIVVWYSGALNMETEAGTLALYAPETGATVVSDGENLYAWEPGKQTLTQVELNGTQTVIYAGDLTQAQDLSLLTSATPDPSATAGADAGSDADSSGNSSWFNDFMENQENSDSSNNSSSGGTTVWTQATPIGATATPAPTPTPASAGFDAAFGVNGGSNSSSGGSSSGGSSGGTSQSGSSYSVSISYVKITGGTVNVRSGPGTGYSVKGTLSKGTIVKCTGKAAKDSGDNTWYQIKRGDGTGWVSAGYAKKSGAPDANYVGPEQSMGGSTVTITGGSVNVRAKPNLNGADLGVVKKGAKLSFKGKKSTDSRGVDWYKVSYNGNTGWVSSRYSKVSGSGSSSGSSYSGGSDASGTKYTSGTINIRTGPGKKYDSIGTIPKGTKLTVKKKAKDAAGRNVTWYQVTYKGKTGWVSGVNLSSSAGGSGSSGGSTSASGSGKTTGQVNLRSKANRNSSSVAIVPKGTTLKYTKTAPDGEGRKGITWYYVSYKGKSGWVSSMYFK